MKKGNALTNVSAFFVIAKHYRYRSKPQFAEKIIGRIYLPTSNL